VGVGKAAGFAVALGDAGAVRDTRQKVVALLEGVHADAVLPGHGPEDGHEPLVHYAGLEVPRRLGRGPEVGLFQEQLRLTAGPGVLSSEETQVPNAPAYA
jgi:hypothetical protein